MAKDGRLHRNESRAGRPLKGRLSASALAAALVALAVIACAAMLSPVARPSAASDRAGGLQREADELGARFRATGDDTLIAPLVRAQIAAGRHSAALALAEQADRTREMSLLQGEALLHLARSQEAWTLAAHILERSPDDGAAALLAGRAAFATGDQKAAFALALTALRGTGVAHSAAWLFRARLALAENDLQAAAAALARAREAGADDLDILPLSVERLLRAGDLAGAKAALGAQSPRGASSDPRVLAAAALTALAADDAASAARMFDALEDVARADPLMRLWHAFARVRAGDDARAAQLFALARSEFPLNPVITLSYGKYLIQAGRLDEVAALIEGAPSQDAIAARLGLLAAIAAADTDGVVKQTGAAACDPALPEAGEALLGGSGAIFDQDAGAGSRICALWKAQFEGRAAPGQTARDASPAEWVLRGRIALARGDDDSAAAAFAAARAADPAAYTAIEGAARVLIRSGKESEAYRLLQSYTASHSDGFEPRVLLAALAEALGQRAAAVDALMPVEAAALREPGLGAWYLEALQSAGDHTALTRVAGLLQRERPRDLLTVRAQRAAGRLDLAASAARIAVVADPGDRAAAAVYKEIMETRGRGEVAREFLASIGAGADVSVGQAEDAGEVTADAPLAKNLFEKARHDYLTDPTDGMSALTYARALEQAGNKAEAVRVAREADVWTAFSAATDAT